MWPGPANWLEAVSVSLNQPFRFRIVGDVVAGSVPGPLARKAVFALIVARACIWDGRRASCTSASNSGRPHLGQQLAILGFINGKVGPANGGRTSISFI